MIKGDYSTQGCFMPPCKLQVASCALQPATVDPAALPRLTALAHCSCRMAQARCIVAPCFTKKCFHLRGEKRAVSSFQSRSRRVPRCHQSIRFLLLLLVVVEEGNDEDEDEPVLPLPAEEGRGEPEGEAPTAPWLTPISQLSATFS